MGSHRNVLSPDRADPWPTAGLVDRSADRVGDAFLLVGTADRGEGRHPVEELCDVRTRTRRSGHRARPAREHDQIEIDGAEPVVEKQWAVSPEVIFEHVEKP